MNRGESMSSKPNGYIGSVALELKKNVGTQKGTQVATEEETKARKSRFLSILDKATATFLKKLEAGEISISTTADLERLVKLTLLLSGEADSIKGKEGTSEGISGSLSVGALNPEIDEIKDLLNMDDDNVKAIYDQIFNKYNDANDNQYK